MTGLRHRNLHLRVNIRTTFWPHHCLYQSLVSMRMEQQQTLTCDVRHLPRNVFIFRQPKKRKDQPKKHGNDNGKKTPSIKRQSQSNDRHSFIQFSLRRVAVSPCFSASAAATRRRRNASPFWRRPNPRRPKDFFCRLFRRINKKISACLIIDDDSIISVISLRLKY